MTAGIVGRTGLARILECSEATTRNLEARGEIAPEAIVDGRPVFSIEKASELRAKRANRVKKRQSFPAAV
jgi:hypothetical protein